MKIDLEELLATPVTPSIRVRVGPGPEDAVYVDQVAFDARKEEILEFCQNIPSPNGIGWKALRPYVGGNGLMAKLLIGLGDVLGVWKMHPPPEIPELWSLPDYPIAIGAVSIRKRAREETLECQCCWRPMGPCDSKEHDLFESYPDAKMCVECDAAGCNLGSPCELEESKTEVPDAAYSERPQDGPQTPDVPAGLDAYLTQFKS